MAVINVNPTRMELNKLKKRLLTAKRGHKLLKDKRDELMRQFLNLVKENKELRLEVEREIEKAHRHFILAGSVMSNEVLYTSLLAPKQEVSLEISQKNVMSVEIPAFSVKTKSSNPSDIYSYGYVFTSGDLDEGVSKLAHTLDKMLLLAEREKSAQLLAEEIEKTRRRVNALEHVMIPRYMETIKYITMKLEENDRSTRARLLKVKDMILEKSYGN